MLGRPFTKTELAIVLAIGLALTLSGAWQSWRLYQEHSIARFQSLVGQRANLFSREIALNTEALFALSILFHKGVTPPIDEFRREARWLLKRHSSIQAIEWVPKVRHSQRKSYENLIMRHYGHSHFKEVAARNQTVKAAERAFYYPVVYIEPALGNERAVGLDMASNRVRQTTLVNTIESGMLSASAGLTLVQDEPSALENSKGVLFFYPVYYQESESAEDRRKLIKGFILGVFRIGDIFNSVPWDGDSGVNYQVVDVTDGTDDALYQLSSSGNALLGPSMHLALPSVGGRQWELRANLDSVLTSEQGKWTPFLIAILGLSLTTLLLIYLRELGKYTGKAEQMALYDHLTEVPNRNYLNLYVQNEWRRAARNQYQVGVLLFDIDHFKQYNDTYGHLAGDDCLKLVAKTLSESLCRGTDSLVRYGGEEFIAIVSETEHVHLVAEKCRAAIESLNIEHKSSSVASVVTVSVGCYNRKTSENTSFEQCVEIADRALYRAKNNGRNRVEEIVSKQT